MKPLFAILITLVGRARHQKARFSMPYTELSSPALMKRTPGTAPLNKEDPLGFRMVSS